MENGDRADKEEKTLEPRDDMAALSYVRGMGGMDGGSLKRRLRRPKRGEGDLDLRL